MRATTRLVAGLILDTPPFGSPRCSATQIAPGVAPIPDGAMPTGIVATTRLVAGSMRVTVSASKFVTHTAPSAATMPMPVVAPTAIVATTRLVAGSMRVTVSLRAFTTQMESKPNVIALGRSPTAIEARTEASLEAPNARSGNAMPETADANTMHTLTDLKRRIAPPFERDASGCVDPARPMNPIEGRSESRGDVCFRTWRLARCAIARRVSGRCAGGSHRPCVGS
jgi:hypothetical protein